tara:strand:+ start:4189 stop:4890 length:702 start_codon:yes stop_codon:yes gene_type:complete
MDDNLDLEAYLFISPKKLIILVNTNLDNKIYKEELILQKEHEDIDLNQLDEFLYQNIFKIEKRSKNFIKNVTIILDLDIFMPIEISIKRNNYEENIDINSLKNILYEAKEDCQKTLQGSKISHMLIDCYKFDGNSYSHLPKNIKCKSYSVDIKFICISDNLYRRLEDILKKYQISLNQVISAKYIENFLSDPDENIFSMTRKIINGQNPNEVRLINKSLKNKGFFEKFFNFFR